MEQAGIILIHEIGWDYPYTWNSSSPNKWPRGQRRWHVSNHGVVAPHSSIHVAWNLVVRLPNDYAAPVWTWCEPGKVYGNGVKRKETNKTKQNKIIKINKYEWHNMYTVHACLCVSSLSFCMVSFHFILNVQLCFLGFYLLVLKHPKCMLLPFL